jgi:hypothetical protein
MNKKKFQVHSEKKSEQKPSKKESHEKSYEYPKISTIFQMKVPSEKIFLYGIINDCMSINRFSSTSISLKLQVADDTVNHLNNQRPLQVEIHTNDTNFPHLINLGDIIRIHRGKLVQFNEQRIVSYTLGGSWIIFSGQIGDDFNPVYISSKNYTFEEMDKSLIICLRHFSKDYFKKESVMSKLNFQLVPIKACEVLAKPCRVFVKEAVKNMEKNEISLKVDDSQHTFEFILPLERYFILKMDDLLVIKNAKSTNR